jgi:hypothetical protein
MKVPATITKVDRIEVEVDVKHIIQEIKERYIRQLELRSDAFLNERTGMWAWDEESYHNGDLFEHEIRSATKEEITFITETLPLIEKLLKKKS